MLHHYPFPLSYGLKEPLRVGRVFRFGTTHVLNLQSGILNRSPRPRPARQLPQSCSPHSPSSVVELEFSVSVRRARLRIPSPRLLQIQCNAVEQLKKGTR